MIKRIGRKEQYVPYATDGKTSVVMWDYSPIVVNGEKTDMGRWKEETIKGQASVEEVKNIILTDYNTKIDNQILSGMTWNDMPIWLSGENQFNYKAIYDIAVQTNGLNLPVIFKFGEVNKPIYYEFKDIETLSDFYLKSVKHVQDTLLNGWKEKDNINWELYQ